MPSALKSYRLYHQSADHGMVRLMIWERPLGAGLGTAPLKVLGSRWTAALTEDIVRIANHAYVAQRKGLPIRYIPPQWTVIYGDDDLKPFQGKLVGVREMLLFRPEVMAEIALQLGTRPRYLPSGAE